MQSHPYHRVGSVTFAGGPETTIRPVLPDEANIETDSCRILTNYWRYFRFMESFREPARKSSGNVHVFITVAGADLMVCETSRES